MNKIDKIKKFKKIMGLGFLRDIKTYYSKNVKGDLSGWNLECIIMKMWTKRI